VKRIDPAASLRQIQDIVERHTGRALSLEGGREVEAVLHGIATAGKTDASAEEFLSREVTILLADLRGFTAMAATHPAGIVIGVLNRCLARMSEVIFRHRGTIDKFMGDSILVVFGAANPQEDDAKRAVACAVHMQLAMDELNLESKARGEPELYMGIGINTGKVTAGFFGSALYSEYTVIGDNVNLASRIESFSLRGQVLISPSTFDRCGDFVQTGNPFEVHVKGKADAMIVREVLAIPPLKLEVPRKEVRRSPRVEVKVPFQYRKIEDNVIIPQHCRGMMADIGYHGILAVVSQSLELYSEVTLDAELPLLGVKVSDISARVVKVKPLADAWQCGIEFTSISTEDNKNIQLFVQLLIQANERR
jgi:adenylate cyclase